MKRKRQGTDTKQGSANKFTLWPPDRPLVSPWTHDARPNPKPEAQGHFVPRPSYKTGYKRRRPESQEESKVPCVAL